MAPTIGQAFYFSGAKIRTYLISSKFFKQIFQYLSKFFLSLPGIPSDINILEPEKSRAVSSILFPDHIGRQAAGLVGEETVDGVEDAVVDLWHESASAGAMVSSVAFTGHRRIRA